MASQSLDVFGIGCFAVHLFSNLQRSLKDFDQTEVLAEDLMANPPVQFLDQFIRACLQPPKKRPSTKDLLLHKVFTETAAK
jgi:hypothetical protein